MSEKKAVKKSAKDKAPKAAKSAVAKEKGGKKTASKVLPAVSAKSKDPVQAAPKAASKAAVKSALQAVARTVVKPAKPKDLAQAAKSAPKAEPSQLLERILTLELVRVTERAAVASSLLRGRGQEKAADQAAVDAMRRELNNLPIDGTVVIGEGERDEAPMLFIGERVGTGKGPKVDIAVDPLEGTTLCAKDMPGSIAVMAMAEGGTLLAAPDVYMEKIAVGPGYPPGIVDLDRSPEENIKALAKAKGVEPKDVTVLILERPRHEDLIRRVRSLGCGIRLITDGDIMGVIFTSMPGETGIDLYMGIGAAPEGVIAAGALRCIGGQMQGRLILDTPEKRERAKKMGVTDPNRKYELTDLARGDVVVAATGVTDGALLDGVRFKDGHVETDTIVYRSSTGTVRRIKAEHRNIEKFHLES